ncbi:protein kinase activating protein dpb11 [Marasmius tenuissimus]|uniref:Protein kinase activating protein dpb11 n=1 Tax=Marasmius tenuissimus TaxID=585030 RepID=A0ABR3A5D1_9AGAR
MRRRGNKSTKVPNVKLRPAQISHKARDLQAEDVWAQDSQLPSDDTAIIDTCPRPFSGIVLCATGVLDKPGLFRQAVELGATTCNAFTDRVTHLVAKDHGGAKYLCALERKIPILSPEWITENYKVWLRGDDVDIEESLTKYKLPVFSNVILCLSGVDDIKRRTQINKYVTRCGGVFVKNLERPVRVTHLLCSGEQETDKMHYAEKFNKKGEADIKLVWEEWFWDSLEYGGRFDEDKYQVRQPRPERRQLHVEPVPATASLPSSEVLDTSESTPRQRANPKDDDEEPASIQRVPAVQLQLWASLLKSRGFEIDTEQGRLMRSPTKSQSRARRQEDESDEEDIGAKAGASKSFIGSAGFRRANSFATSSSKPLRRILSSRKATPVPEADEGLNLGLHMDVDTPGAGPSRLRSAGPSSLANVVNVEDTEMNAPVDAQPLQPAKKVVPKSSTSVFGGRQFLLLGEADSHGVRAAIRSNGGSFVDGRDVWNEQYEVQVDFVIVRLASGSSIYGNLPSSASPAYREKFRTECWLEQCLFEERICEPDQHVTFTPLDIPCPVDGAKSVFVNFSGLEESEKHFTTRLVKTLGLNFLSTFTRRATHLLCPSAEGLKYEKAKEWGIPVVGMSWMESLKETGRVPDVDEHLVPGQDINRNRAGNTKTVSVVVNEQRLATKDPKGKGKALEVDPRMADITNSQSQTQDDSQAFEFKPQVTSTQKDPPVDDIPPMPSLSNLHLYSPAGSFGKPNGLLGNPVAEHSPQLNDCISPAATQPHDTPSPEPDSIPPPFLGKGKGKEKAFGPAHSEPVIGSSPITARSLARRPTTEADLSGMGVDMNSLSVPSSRTPSPVKMTSAPRDTLRRKGSNGNMKGRGRTGFSRKKSGSMSPSKGGHYVHNQRPMEIDEERAKALQESVTNLLNDTGGGGLLGKRRSEESEGGSGEVGGYAGNERVGKRPRPTRPKPRTRNQQAQTAVAYQPVQDAQLDLEFGGNAVELEEQVQASEESMRVTYEDPAQRDEKRKLMRLFEGGDDDSEFEIISVTKAPERSSTSAAPRRNGRKSIRAK